MTTTPATQPPASQNAPGAPATLMQALGFDADDLAANRRGQLSEAQLDLLVRRGSARTRLHALLLTTLLASTASGMAMALLLWAVRALLPDDDTPLPSARDQSLAGVGLTGLLTVFSTTVTMRRRRAQRWAAQQAAGALRQVESVRGPVHTGRTLVVVGDAQQSYVECAGVYLLTDSAAALSAFTPGQAYALYYLPGTRRLLSAEAL